MKFTYFAKVNGKTSGGPIEASSMTAAVKLVAGHFGLGAVNKETTSEVVHLVKGSDFVEISLKGSRQKRAAVIRL